MRLKEFIFTAFYSGYSPVAPGSAGTLVGMALYCLEYLAVGKASWIFNLAAVVVLFYPFLKFEECCWVDLSQFTLGRSESAQECDFGFFFEELRRATAKEFGVDI